MRVMKFISVAAILVMISALAVAQQAPAQSSPQVRHVPITNAPSNSGKEMFKSYCAVRHGTDAKGNGPAASAMKTCLTPFARASGAGRAKFPRSAGTA